MSDVMLKAALAYAKRGWFVFPLQPGGKVPLEGTHAHHDATLDRATIRSWWRETPDANVALALAPSRLVVVDRDGPESRAVAAKLRLPPTLAATSGRPDREHLYYALPKDAPPELVRRFIKIRPAFDVLGDGYVVAPPSFRKDTGEPYRWVNEHPIAPLPPSVVKLVTRRVAEKARDTVATATNGASAPLPAATLPPRLVELSDAEVCERVAAANPSEFHRLFESGETRPGKSASESDLALACMFARVVGGDIERIDRLMRLSALADEAGRDAPKWDETRPGLDGPETWLARTIRRAIATVARERSTRGDASERRFYSLAEILLDDDLLKKPDPLLPHVAWVGRLTLLAGREKYAGKSTFLASAAACVSRGAPFLGKPCPVGDVLWVSADLEHTYDIAERFVRYDADPARVHVLYPEFAGLDDRLAEIESVVTRVRPRLVVLDTLSNLARVKDPFASTEWPEALLRLKELARVQDAAIVVVHHTPKGNEREYRDSTAIGATVDQIVMLINERDGKHSPPPQRRALESRGRLGVSEIAIDLGAEGYRVVESEARTLERRVREYVAAHPGATFASVRDAMGAKREKVSKVLDALVKRGAVIDTGGGQKHAYAIGTSAPRSADAITLTIEEFERGRTAARIASWRADRAPRNNTKAAR